MVDRPALLFGPGEEVRWMGRTYVVAPHLQFREKRPSDSFGLYVSWAGGLTRAREEMDVEQAVLRGYEANGHPGIFIETVWGSVFRDHPHRPRLPAPPGSPNSWPSGDDIIERLQASDSPALTRSYQVKGYLVTNPMTGLQRLERRLRGEHLQDFYMGDASMLRIGDTMRVLHSFSEDVIVTEEHRAARHPCAFLRGHLPVFWGVSRRPWDGMSGEPAT